jgi:hypothetical protein
MLGALCSKAIEVSTLRHHHHGTRRRCAGVDVCLCGGGLCSGSLCSGSVLSSGSSGRAGLDGDGDVVWGDGEGDGVCGDGRRRRARREHVQIEEDERCARGGEEGRAGGTGW